MSLPRNFVRLGQISRGGHYGISEVNFDRNLPEIWSHVQRGAIAQLARASALQAGGPGFESLWLHQDERTVCR